MLLATEMLMKWPNGPRNMQNFPHYQRAQNRDVETIMLVHASCVPDIDLKILQSQPTQGDVKHWAENGCVPDANGLIQTVE